VLVVENVGPLDAVKRSWGVMKKTWGESIGANFGVGFMVFLGTLVCMVPLFGGAWLITQGTVPLGITAVVLGVVGLMVVSLVSSALNTIILAALYLYASDHEAPQHFDERLLRGAFAAR
jgi:type II secretory pathway component PulF